MHTHRKHTYNNGQPYRPAFGHAFPRDQVEQRSSTIHPVVLLTPQLPHADFLTAIQRELKIRCYAKHSQKNYLSSLQAFLKWYAGPLSKISTDAVRMYLEILVDGGASSSHVAQVLSALRTTLDKMCGLASTTGLVTPRKAKRLPRVLSQEQIRRLLESARSLAAKTAIAFMYGAGLRVSEVSRLHVCSAALPSPR